jgi:hypothetical protein
MFKMLVLESFRPSRREKFKILETRNFNDHCDSITLYNCYYILLLALLITLYSTGQFNYAY